jgi:hypothetical protein
MHQTLRDLTLSAIRTGVSDPFEVPNEAFVATVKTVVLLVANCPRSDVSEGYNPVAMNPEKTVFLSPTFEGFRLQTGYTPVQFYMWVTVVDVRPYARPLDEHDDTTIIIIILGEYRACLQLYLEYLIDTHKPEAMLLMGKHAELAPTDMLALKRRVSVLIAAHFCMTRPGFPYRMPGNDRAEQELWCKKHDAVYTRLLQILLGEGARECLAFRDKLIS